MFGIYSCFGLSSKLAFSNFPPYSYQVWIQPNLHIKNGKSIFEKLAYQNIKKVLFSILFEMDSRKVKNQVTGDDFKIDF